MNVLFVKSDKIGSKIIRWGLQEPASHMAVEFVAAGIIYHAYGTSIQRVVRTDFHYDIVDRVVLPVTGTQDAECENYFRSCTAYQKYDYPALAYFALLQGGKRIFGRPFPAINNWNVPDWNICTEIGYLVGEAYAKFRGEMILPEKHDLSITSPWQFRALLKDRLTAIKVVG